MLRLLQRLLSPRAGREPAGPALASVYRRGSRLAVHAHVRNRDWILLAAEPYLPLPAAADAFEVGQAVLRALQAYRSGVDRSAREKIGASPLFKALGVRSWRSLMDGAVLCAVSKGSRYEVTPTRNGGTRGDDRGFHDLTDETISLDLAVDAAQLGAAVLRCLDRCG